MASAAPISRSPAGPTHQILPFIDKLLDGVVTLIVRVATFPYYRLFHFNTVGVIQRMARYEQDPQKFPASVQVLQNWRERKLEELQFISIACAVLAGAVIGSFSWYTIKEAFWLAAACWYSSLVFAVLGILLSAQQIAVFKFLGDIPGGEYQDARRALDRYKPLLIEPSNASKTTSGPQTLATTRPLFRPKRSMIFVWQCPIMFMSYSVCLFLLGLTMLVITPLIRIRERGWHGDVNSAIFYLGASTVSGVAFLFCSFWIYHFVEFESDLLPDARQTFPIITLPVREDAQSAGDGIRTATASSSRV